MASKKLNTKGSRTQDLQAAREELKQFRRDVAILKKKGLIDKNKYDARSVKPTKYLKSVIREFGNVINGEATPVRVSKERAKYYKEKGYSVRNGRVIVPHMENEKVYGTHGNFVRKITGRGGSIQVMDLGLDNRDINRWVDDLRNNRFKLRTDEQLRFQMYGNNSHTGFTDTARRTAQEQMADYLEFYESFENALEGGLSPEQESEYVQSIVIFKVKRDGAGHWPRPPSRAEEYPENIEARERRSRRNAERRRARIGRMNEREYNEYMDEKARAEKERRNSMTEDQRKRAAEQAAERMRKYRSKKRQKNGEEKT
jgi:hypothetical protein